MIALLASSTNANITDAECIEVFVSEDDYGACMQMSFIDIQKVRGMQLEGGLYSDKAWRLCVHALICLHVCLHEHKALAAYIIMIQL